MMGGGRGTLGSCRVLWTEEADTPDIPSVSPAAVQTMRVTVPDLVPAVEAT